MSGGRSFRPVAESKDFARMRSDWALIVALLMITLIAYFPAIHHPFVGYDDPDYITENKAVQEGLSVDTLTWALGTTACSNWHPVTWMSHALDCEMFGLDPAGHHVTSVVIHAANVILMFLLLAWSSKRSGVSFLVAALFALHPLNVESVAWVAERKTLLSMFFFLLTLGAYGWYARKPAAGRYAVVIGLAVLALAAKPMVVTLPCVLLLIDFWPLQRVLGGTPYEQTVPGLRQRPLAELIREKLPLLALSVASSVITIVAQKPALKTTLAIPLDARIKNAVVSYLLYLGKVIWPLRLGVFYAHEGSRIAIWRATLAFIVLIAVTVAVWKIRSRDYLRIGWLWYLGTLVPMIGLVQAGEQGMADRYTYLPLLGIFVGCVWGLSELADGFKVPLWVRVGVTAIVLGAMLCLTRRQLRSWESTFAMWSHSLAVSSENYVAEDYVGATLLEEGFQKTGQSCVPDALAHFQNAVRVNPHDALGHLNTGYCDQAHGDLSAAIAEYKEALQFAPTDYLKVHADLNLGAALQQSGEFAMARGYFEDGMKIHPRDRELQSAMAQLEIEERVARMSEEARSHPTAWAYIEIGRMQRDLGHRDQAEASFERAASLDPKNPQAQAELASIKRTQP